MPSSLATADAAVVTTAAAAVAILACLATGLAAAGLPEDAMQLVATTDRAAVSELVAMEAHVDAVVPRGGKGLIERVAKDARVVDHVVVARVRAPRGLVVHRGSHRRAAGLGVRGPPLYPPAHRVHPPQGVNFGDPGFPRGVHPARLGARAAKGGK